jgi:hypothetical protein
MMDKLLQTVRGAIATLEQTDCTFWACRGPDAPYEDMITCSICATVKDLRAALAEALEELAPLPR